SLVRRALRVAAGAASCASGSLALLCSGHADHPGLLSFPTRRSSDLRPTCGISPSRPCAARSAAASSRVSPSSFFSVGAAAWPPRSEEHTSELQSRENLVCRLLLEKKKAASTAATVSVSW